MPNLATRQTEQIGKEKKDISPREKFIKSDLSEMDDWFSSNAPSVNRIKLREKLIDWCNAKGKTYKDYFAAYRNWAKEEHEKNVQKSWTPPKTPVDRYNPYAHLTGGA